MSTDVLGISSSSKAREAEEKRLQERRRSTLVLILRHLCDSGYIEAYERLSKEVNLDLSKVDVADNIDLLTIIQEYEDVFEARYGKRPKLVRLLKEQPATAPGRSPVAPGASSTTRAASDVPKSGVLSAYLRREKGTAAAAGSPASSSPRPAGTAAGNSSNAAAPGPRAGSLSSVPGAAPSGSKKALLTKREGSQREISSASELGIEVAGVNVNKVQQDAGSKAKDGEDDADPQEFYEQRLLKPLPVALAGEWRDLGSAVSRDILQGCPNVRWQDIAGLDQAKRLLQEAVVMPMRYPHLFTGLLTPWKGVLLYGPPGTGKTLLAKAVATECRTTFFNISASSLMSKWRGDSERMVRVLFELARHHAPSTIFLDEVDALMAARGGDNEHEASRRLKTELLVQLDGLASAAGSSNGDEQQPAGSQVFVLAATNLPWELDQALLRRLDKRVMVDLPDSEAREGMLRTLLADRAAPDVSFQHFSSSTQGYSGSDIHLLAKEAAMRPVRRLMAGMALAQHQQEQRQQKAGQPASAHPEVGPVTVQDIQDALAATKPSARQLEARYQQFSQEYGQVM